MEEVGLRMHEFRFSDRWQGAREGLCIVLIA
jgi:hypothetical protein